MLRRLAAIAAVLAALPVVSACGEEEEVTRAESEGLYVTVDHLRYQVQISRLLQAQNVEDAAYIEGVPPEERELAANEEWFAIFLRVENESEDETYRAARDIFIEDTTGREFEPVPLDPDRTPLSYEPVDLGPQDLLPARGSIPGTSTTQGAVLLFKIPRENFENRPLELWIRSPGGEPAEATVELDV